MPPTTVTAESRRRSWSSLLRNVRVLAAVLVLASGAVLASAPPVGAWTNGTFSPDDEQLLFSLTNQARASAGLPVLRNDSFLHSLARWRSKDMYDRNYFSHNIPPSGEMVFAVMQQDGYCFKVAGENIGVSGYPDATATENIQVAFMDSPEHRANIMGNWRNMGVGAYKGANGKKLYTVLFSMPCGATTTATPKPTPRPTPKPTANSTPRPTPKPTAKATAPPNPTAAAITASPTAAPTATATAAPSAMSSPTGGLATAPGATGALATSTVTPGPSGPVVPTGSVASLRVRDQPAGGSIVDALFQGVFGGLFGW